MCYHDRSTVFGYLVQCRLYYFFPTVVNGACGFIEDQDLGISDDGPSYC